MPKYWPVAAGTKIEALVYAEIEAMEFYLEDLLNILENPELCTLAGLAATADIETEDDAQEASESLAPSGLSLTGPCVAPSGLSLAVTGDGTTSSQQPLSVTVFSQTHNLLDEDVRNSFRSEVIMPENEAFTAAINTTNTVEAQISNVYFMEEDLTAKMETNKYMVIVRSNYGSKKWPGYVIPEVERKSNRGRKRKEKKVKARKCQGDGREFNSQVSPWVRARDTDTKVYKFKLFRTGKIQLPGVQQHLIDDVITCARRVEKAANLYLHGGQPISRLTYITHVMKNYKFRVKCSPAEILDLAALRDIVAAPPEGCPPRPDIHMIKYSRQDSKMSVLLSTPMLHKPDKNVRINAFLRGRINILGGYNSDMTRGICEFFTHIFTVGREQIVVRACEVETKPRRKPIPRLSWTEVDQFHTDNIPRLSARDVYERLFVPVPVGLEEGEAD